MDRQRWLAERRQTAEERHDTIHAFTYDEHYGEIGEVHRRFVADLLERCPPGGTVLDAACGTGKYFAMVLEAGRRVVGTDQSTGMLGRARSRFPAVPLERVGLQELDFAAEFDAVMCIDAMENIPPEDWPTVVANLRRALRPGGHLYLTVEEVDDQELLAAISDMALDLFLAESAVLRAADASARALNEENNYPLIMDAGISLVSL